MYYIKNCTTPRPETETQKCRQKGKQDLRIMWECVTVCAGIYLAFNDYCCCCFLFFLVHCLLFLEKLCEAQLSEVFQELANASLNFAWKCLRAFSSV